MLTTLDPPGTKSTVTAWSPSATESVAVSPVSSTSARSCGRASSRTSRRDEHAVGERDEVQPEPVRAAGLALDQPAALERGEEPRRAGRVHADPARERVDARRPFGERVEQRERPCDRADRPAAVVAHARSGDELEHRPVAGVLLRRPRAAARSSPRSRASGSPSARSRRSGARACRGRASGRRCRRARCAAPARRSARRRRRRRRSPAPRCSRRSRTRSADRSRSACTPA